MKERFKYEKELYDKGVKLIGGIDEAGRGPLYGPVVAAMVVLPKEYYNNEIKDSKKLSESKRELLYDEIQKNALGIGIGIVSAKVIDEINILEATKIAMIKAIVTCSVKPQHILIDAVKLDISIPFTPIIKGDNLSISIAAASIIAKVTRDRIMIEANEKYPEYGFIHNKGYGTKQHLEAISKYGVLEEHRKSFNKVK